MAPPYSANTQVKLNGSYTLPWDVQASAAFQNLPGVPISASYVATNAQIAPSLGRSLSGNATQVSSPTSSRRHAYEDRFSQLDVRLSKTFRIGPTRLQASFDLFNILNSSPILTPQFWALLIILFTFAFIASEAVADFERKVSSYASSR